MEQHSGIETGNSRTENINELRRNDISAFFESAINNKVAKIAEIKNSKLMKIAKNPYLAFELEPPFDGSSIETETSIANPLTGDINITVAAGNVYGQFHSTKVDASDFLQYRYNENSGTIKQKIRFPTQQTDFLAKITVDVKLPQETDWDNKTYFMLSHQTGDHYQSFLGAEGRIQIEANSHVTEDFFLYMYQSSASDRYGHYVHNSSSEILIPMSTRTNSLDLNITAHIKVIDSAGGAAHHPPDIALQFSILDFRNHDVGYAPINRTIDNISYENTAYGSIKIEKIKVEFYHFR